MHGARGARRRRAAGYRSARRPGGRLARGLRGRPPGWKARTRPANSSRRTSRPTRRGTAPRPRASSPATSSPSCAAPGRRTGAMRSLSTAVPGRSGDRSISACFDPSLPASGSRGGSRTACWSPTRRGPRSTAARWRRKGLELVVGGRSCRRVLPAHPGLRAASPSRTARPAASPTPPPTGARLLRHRPASGRSRRAHPRGGDDACDSGLAGGEPRAGARGHARERVLRLLPLAREGQAADGPVGAQGVALTAGRSLAVDRRFVPMTVPIWLDEHGARPRSRQGGSPAQAPHGGAGLRAARSAARCVATYLLGRWRQRPARSQAA